MASIPAAGLGKAKIDAIEVSNPNLAAEIRRLNERIAEGRNSSKELQEFIRLVFVAGEKDRSEFMLRAAIDTKWDTFYLLYSELFGSSPDSTLEKGVEDFKRRFNVFLFDARPLRFLQIDYSAKIPKDSNLHRFSTFVHDKIYTATFSGYEPSGMVSVDLQSEGAGEALPLNWDGNVWAIPNWFNRSVARRKKGHS